MPDEIEMVYLAAPYSHEDFSVKEARFHIINKCAAALMSDGHYIYSPISQTHSISVAGGIPGSWEYWEAYDRKIISICSKLMVLMLDGWSVSVGVRAEIGIAREFGLSIEYISPSDILCNTESIDTVATEE